ncbi:alpha-glucosidase/metallo-beta-lactamase class B [Mucilaginibacter pineti]|uniref:Alpha-glucosidase/metallo-beta-lactamase class B n=1 Tax=Mucilaginibacter pineti TaxID=1391627 RepID=A0A1G7I460_9SPHI|nr:alpha/beta hydrolase-fold protein [Mucilaginibacter pineti]SDF07139.1 alpha-glucosidase/metallo-beta-lactamase class B [Mucilaginibacter pineti]
MRKKNIFCAFLLFGQSFFVFSQVKIIFKTRKIAAPKQPSGHLFLAGTFNGWNPADSTWQLQPDGAGSYLLMKDMPKGISTYKITRGSWNTVECTSTGKGVDNRTLSLLHDTTVTLSVDGWQDSFAAVEKKHTATTQVHIINDKFEMPQLGRQRRVWICLPAGYESSKKRYPVIYMHDGQNLFDEYTSGYGEWGIDEFMEKLSPQEQCIVVGIDHGGDYRISEYDPYDSNYGKGRGDDYIQFLIKNLKPYIDAHYHTKTDAAHTAIAGSSMGGLISMYAVLKYPKVFGNAGVFSPAFWIAPDIYQLAKQQAITNKTRFYFVCGSAEGEYMVTYMQKMADIVRQKGVSTKNSPVVIIKDASHNEKQWNGDFPDFYNWLF